VEGDGIVKGLPLPISVPPQLPVNHFNTVPEPPVVERFIFPPSLSQKLLLSVVALVGDTGIGSTLTVTLAQLELPHPV
jgi:hypothetical protein